MAVNLPIYKRRRVVLLRFKRATTGDPDPVRPDIDDRGWRDDFGPIVGVTQGTTVIVRLTRERLGDSARLYAVSSDPTIVTVTNPKDSKLPAKTDMDLELHAVGGGSPKTTKIEIRFESTTGPIVHLLNVWAFTKVPVRITPHLVTIRDAKHAGIASVTDPSKVIDKVQAIWRPCGVEFDVRPTVRHEHTFADAGIIRALKADGQTPTDALIELFSMKYVPHTINAYFVHAVHAPGKTSLGLGITRERARGTKGLNPGIVVADIGTIRDSRGEYHLQSLDTMEQSRTFAHEIGHFFGLSHPEEFYIRSNTWVLRRLMHQSTAIHKAEHWTDTRLGYGISKEGFLRMGCLLTMKRLPPLNGGDDEARIVRKLITSSKGPY